MRERGSSNGAPGAGHESRTGDSNERQAATPFVAQRRVPQAAQRRGPGPAGTRYQVSGTTQVPEGRNQERKGLPPRQISPAVQRRPNQRRKPRPHSSRRDESHG